MPAATPEDLLAELDSPHWKAPGSTSVRAEGPTARATEGSAAVNLTVLDHLDAGRRRLAEAERLTAKGTPGARTQAEAIRRTQHIKSALLKGDTSDIRQTRCLACACYSLQWRGGRVQGSAVCVNLHCSIAAHMRSWTLSELATAAPPEPGPVRRHRGPVAPCDLVDAKTAAVQLAQSGKPASVSTIKRWLTGHRLPVWAIGRARVCSMSDLFTVHAAWAAAAEPVQCTAPAASARKLPACAGLADLFFSDGSGPDRPRAALAKQLCESCPLRQPCLEQALEYPAWQQHGIYGGLTAAERQQLLKARR